MRKGSLFRGLMKKRAWIIVAAFVICLGILWSCPFGVRKRFEYRRANYLRVQQSEGRYWDWQQQLSQKTVRAAKIFAAPDKVEIFRLEDMRLQGNPRYDNLKKIDGLAYRSKSVYNDPALAKRLTDLVLNPYSYSLTHSACIFNPGVAFRFSKGTQTALIAICFHCNQLALIENDPHLPLTSIDGPLVRLRFIADIDFYRPEFLEIVKAAFPNDPEIQKLETYKYTFL
jgi:hypothetical protein